MIDQNFDVLAERFAKRIYGSDKGAIRLAIIWQQLLDDFPEITAGKPLRILDVGAGMGQLSLRLAQLGHHLVVADASSEMLKMARNAFYQAGFPCIFSTEHTAIDMTSIEPLLLQCTLQALPESGYGKFDLVIFHAVMEWLALPLEGLDRVIRFLDPEAGRLSVMFYNKHSLVFRNIIRGNFRKIQSESFKGDQGGLTPQNPLEPDEVQARLEENNILINSCTGVRVFVDYMNKSLERSLEDKIAIERLYCRQQPYAHMARYVLFHGQVKPDYQKPGFF